MTRSLRLACACALGLAFVPAHAQTIADWTFENDSQAVNNTPAADLGSGTASALGMGVYPTPNVGVNTDDVLAGVTGDTGTNGVADTSNIWRIRAQGTTSAAANGWSSLAPIGTQGAEFAASTVGVNAPITVSFDWYSTTKGEANLELEYTTNGGASWTNLKITPGGLDTGLSVINNTSGSMANTVQGYYVNGGTAGQEWFTGLSATITDPLAQNNANFAIAMVNATTGAADLGMNGTALNNNSGNWRFDNVSITSAVPEPGTYAMLSVSGLLLLLAARRKRGGASLAI